MATPKKKVARKRPAVPVRRARAPRGPRAPRASSKKRGVSDSSNRELPEFLQPESDRQPRTPEKDIFRPPKKNCRVFCLHCQEKYDSYRIEWREFAREHGAPEGFWCCPIEGCDGKGFLFDIYPTDPNWEDEEDRGMTGGWVDDDGNPCPPDFADDIPF